MSKQDQINTDDCQCGGCTRLPAAIACQNVTPTKARCDGMDWSTKTQCPCNELTHIDNKGFTYCASHGPQRKAGGVPCRKLKPSEVKLLQAGQPIKRY